MAIALMPAAFGFGIAAPTFDTPFPIAWDQLEPSGGIKGGPAESYLVIRIHGQPAWALRTWIGHEAPRTSVAEAKAVVASLLVRGASRWETYQDAARGFTVTYPADWFRARQSLLAESSSAREILSLATTASGRVAAPAPASRFPATPSPASGWVTCSSRFRKPRHLYRPASILGARTSGGTDFPPATDMKGCRFAPGGFRSKTRVASSTRSSRSAHSCPMTARSCGLPGMSWTAFGSATFEETDATRPTRIVDRVRGSGYDRAHERCSRRLGHGPQRRRPVTSAGRLRSG